MPDHLALASQDALGVLATTVAAKNKHAGAWVSAHSQWVSYGGLHPTVVLAPFYDVICVHLLESDFAEKMVNVVVSVQQAMMTSATQNLSGTNPAPHVAGRGHRQ